MIDNALYAARSDPHDLRIEELFDLPEYLWVESLNVTPLENEEGTACSDVVVRFRISQSEGGDCWATFPIALTPRMVAILLMYANFFNDPEERDRLADKYDIAEFLPPQDDRANKTLDETLGACSQCGKRHFGKWHTR
jgi:hypothetical protein